MSDIFDSMFKKKEDTKEKKPFKKFNKEKKINLFKETPNKKEIDMDNVNFVNDVAILLYDNKPLPDDIKDKFKKLFKLLNDKNYNIRLRCVNSNELLPIIKSDYNVKRVNLVKPWEKFCDVKDFRVWTPSNINIEYAANYVNNFDKLPTGLKYIKSSYLTMLTSYTGKHLVKYVLVYDPYFNKKDKLDFTKSKDTYDMYKLVNNIGAMTLFNINDDEELKVFVELLSK